MIPYLNLPNDTTRVTVELRDILTGDHPVDLWAFDYPSYYEGEAKRAFEQKVIDHFYFRQIGAETVGRWLHMFRSRMREIMPYYMQMYKSVEIMNGISDPFGNIDITETFEQTAAGNRTGNTTGKSSGTQTSETSGSREETVNKEHRFSNTPQSSIDNLDNYLTEASRDTDTASASDTHSTNTSDESNTEGTTSEETSNTVTHTLTRKGNQGVNTYAHDMIEFRQSFIDVDMMIINNLQDLFLMVY